jgi:hypothetical protein
MSYNIVSLLVKNELPEGNYGIQLGDYNFKTGKIVWGGAQWNLKTTEQVARELANKWRQESLEKVMTKGFGRKIEGVNPGLVTEERVALFFRPIELDQK